ncbi:MAG: toll/interleukin-1 receptor domain-containing protein, partial [Rhizobiales bacterium]|nr:toll/interleukin-1 receptor domain-containing protein [Hyphomicrobiales bacterium]
MTDATPTPRPADAPASTSDAAAARGFVYDAFISYSQRGDRAVARALRTVVQTIGTPWWKVRGLNVFLDATSLSAAPSLWQGIAEKLAVSRYLILLASPEAAASKWVDREVSSFLERHGKDRLLIALTDGALDWDEALGDFRAEGGVPLPPSLRGRFAEEPLWVDLRPFRRDPATATKSNQAFLHAALDLAATIRGVEKADLYSDELRRQRRMLRLAYGTAGVVALLAVGAGIAAYVAIENEARAVRNFDIARKTVDDVVFDVSQGLREVEGMRTETIRTILGSVEEAVSRLSEAAADDTEILRSRGAMLDEFGDTYAAAGDRASALEAYRESLDIARQLAAADPDDMLHQRSIAVALSAIGDMALGRGDTAAAITSFQAYLDIARTLAALDPDNVEWARDVPLALGRIGRARLAAGDLDGAMAAQTESLEIHRRLAESDPTD